MSVSRSDPLNAMRWSRETPCHYEVWYLTLFHRKTGHAFWIRYTLHAPLKGPKTACLWFVRFAPPNEGGILSTRSELSWDRVRCEGSPFRLLLGEAELTNERCSGSLDGPEGRISWSLSHGDAGPRMKHLPAFLYSLPFPKTKVVSPFLDEPFQGTVQLPSRSYLFEGDPGEQSHVWGRKHGHEWCWGHCNAFEKDNVVFEAVAARLWERAPWISLFFLKVDEREFLLNDVKGFWRRRSAVSFPEWRFRAGGKGLSIEGRWEAPGDAWIRAGYKDPDGEELSCYNTGLGSLTLRLEARNETPRVLDCEGAAAWEFGTRRPLGRDWTFPEV